MKTILFYAALTILIAFICGLKITFRPFKLVFYEWRYFLGIVFLVLSLIFFRLHHYNEGYKKGENNALDWTIKTIREHISKRKNQK
jgi:hypothetical protein